MVTSCDSSLKLDLAKSVLRSYRRMVGGGLGEKGGNEVLLILMSGCFDRASDKRELLSLGERE